MDFTFGINFVNPFKSEIYYITENQADYLPYGIKYGFSGSYSLNIYRFFNQDLFITYFTDKALVIYSSYDKANYGSIRKVDGYGLEISLLDIFSYRIGHTKNIITNFEGYSYSFGLNLFYRNKIGVAVDFTEMFDSSEIYSPEKWNFSAKYYF